MQLLGQQFSDSPAQPQHSLLRAEILRFRQSQALQKCDLRDQQLVRLSSRVLLRCMLVWFCRMLGTMHSLCCSR